MLMLLTEIIIAAPKNRSSLDAIVLHSSGRRRRGMRGARLGLDESSRDVLLDLIYRLSLRDRDAKDERKERKRSDARKDDEESARDDDDADLTEEERERRARKDRVKEARRAEKTREKKEKVLRKALREDRRNPTKGGGGGGGGGGGDGVDGAAIEGLASAPFEVGSTVNVNVTSTSGGYGCMIPLSHKFFSAMRYFVSPMRSKNRRQNASVPKLRSIVPRSCKRLRARECCSVVHRWSVKI